MSTPDPVRLDNQAYSLVIQPACSVIVRSKNSAATLEATFRSLREQTVSSEIVVVDSGSRDATLALARRWADRLVEIPAWEFSFGGSLNTGAQAATGEIHLALSSHSTAERPDWIERSRAHYDDPSVAATTGTPWDANGMPLLDTVYLDATDTTRHPYWGFSNTAASWRASVWAEHPFNDQMDACEDKEWSWRVTRAGWRIVVDPRLSVIGHHRRRAGVWALFDRHRRESRNLAAYVEMDGLTFRGAVDTWLHNIPDSAYPPLFYRLNYLRIAEIAGRYIGEREGRRRQSASPRQETRDDD